MEPALSTNDNVMETNTAHRQLWEAYRATTYQALRDDEVIWSVRIDEPAPVAGPMAYITSDNPGSRALSQRTNKERRTRLRAELDTGDRELLPGRSVADDDGTWPDEYGYWIRPVDIAQAKTVGRRWGQNAVVFVGADRSVHLVPCEHPDDDR